MPEWCCEKSIFSVPVYSVRKTWWDKRLRNAIWIVTQTCSDFHLWELLRDVQTEARSKDNSSIHTSLISLDTWQVTHLPLLLSFCIASPLSFSFPELFTCWVEKGIWIGALTTVELSVSPSARLHSHFKTEIGNPLPSLHIHLHVFSSLSIYKSFGARIKACIQRDEWFNLDSNGIKWANRNSWQKLYDGEVITCRLLPYCRRWEWSAGLVYRSNCMTQFREWETNMGRQIPAGFNTSWVLLCMKSWDSQPFDKFFKKSVCDGETLMFSRLPLPGLSLPGRPLMSSLLFAYWTALVFILFFWSGFCFALFVIHITFFLGSCLQLFLLWSVSCWSGSLSPLFFALSFTV